MVLEENGWEAINLGPNLPLTSLRQAMLDCQPRLIWLSISHLVDVSGFLDGFRELARAAEKAGVPIIAGGFAVTTTLREEMPYCASAMASVIWPSSLGPCIARNDAVNVLRGTLIHRGVVFPSHHPRILNA